MLEEIYSEAWYMGKEEIFRKYKRTSSRIWEKNQCRNKKIRKVGYSRGKRL